jgi:hypothetical protein
MQLDITISYCDMTPERRNGEVRIDVHCWVTCPQTYLSDNEYASNSLVFSLHFLLKQIIHRLMVKGVIIILSSSRSITYCDVLRH